MKVSKICERIKKKEMTINMLNNKIEPNSEIPTSSEIEQAKEKTFSIMSLKENIRNSFMHLVIISAVGKTLLRLLK